MRRRALLGATATLVPAVTAGCVSTGGIGGELAVAERPTARLDMTAIPDGKLPSQVLYSVRPDGGDRSPGRLVEAATDGGTTTRAVRPPLPAGEHLAVGDVVYELDREVVERTPATSYSVRVDVVTGSVDDAEAVRFSELPAADRDVFEAHGLASGDVVGVGTTVLYTDEQRDASVLVPDPEYAYITWADGAEARWVVDGARETTLNTYRYTGERVASAAAYGRRMRERFAFELADLPEPQRALVDTAVADGRYVVGPDETTSEAFRGLADRFRDREEARGLEEAADGDLSGNYLVRYEDAVYWTTLVVADGALGATTG